MGAKEGEKVGGGVSAAKAAIDAQVARGDPGISPLPVQRASAWPWRKRGRRTVSDVPRQACIRSVNNVLSTT